VNINDDAATAGPATTLEITQVSIDLTAGLFAFTYADGITEHMEVRDPTELPTVWAFLTALNAEVATFGRPRTRVQLAEPHNRRP